jgi:thioredoxin-dependent peroxiredoxin
MSTAFPYTLVSPSRPDNNQRQYPMLSDESGEARKAYSVGRGLMGLSEGRVTFFVDSQGVVRYAFPFLSFPFLSNPWVNSDSWCSEVFDSVINFNGHIKAVSRALEEYRKASEPGEAPAAAATGA